MAVRKLKHPKAAGHYQIPVEFIKEGGEELKKIVYGLMSNI
jgi:hypothetical protein